MDNKVMFFVINEEGLREDAQILSFLISLALRNDFVTKNSVLWFGTDATIK